MALLELRVNGSTVMQSPQAGVARGTRGDVGPVSVESFTRTYDDPATLIFRVDRDVFSPAFAADSRVELFVNGAMVFLGLAGPPQPVLSTDGQPPTQRYTCLDHTSALGPFVDRWDQTSIALKGGNLPAVLAEYLDRVALRLSRVGIQLEFLYSGSAASQQCYPVTVQSGTIDGGFREIAAAAMGVRCFLDPNGGQPAYRFVSLFDQMTARYDITFETVRVPELAIKQSVEGRCGAVRTADSEQIAQLEEQFFETLDKDWDPARESEWRPTKSHDAVKGPDAINESSDDTRVYRRFSFASFADRVPKDTSLAVFISAGDPEDDKRYRHVEIEDVDWENACILLREPAIKDPNRRICIGQDVQTVGTARPAAATLQWKVRGEQFLSEDGYRVPPGNGYSGRAYALAPITCGYERLIAVPAGVDAERYVVQAFNVLSEPVVSGRLPISGDLPNALWMLGRRINIKRQSGGTTGYENLAAPLLGITVEFEGGGRCELEFSNDKSALLRGGVG